MPMIGALAIFIFLCNILGLFFFLQPPTANTNTTFALSISVLVLTLYFAISVKGAGGWLHELFCAPFGKHPLL